jgi:hypothetical protein
MLWDDELNNLKVQVVDAFGEDEYDAAVRRVLAVVTSTTRSADEGAPLEFLREALLIEFRRLLQPH